MRWVWLVLLSALVPFATALTLGTDVNPPLDSNNMVAKSVYYASSGATDANGNTYLTITYVNSTGSYPLKLPGVYVIQQQDIFQTMLLSPIKGANTCTSVWNDRNGDVYCIGSNGIVYFT